MSWTVVYPFEARRAARRDASSSHSAARAEQVQLLGSATKSTSNLLCLNFAMKVPLAEFSGQMLSARPRSSNGNFIGCRTSNSCSLAPAARFPTHDCVHFTLDET
jgi:hypothetical protein